MFLIDLRHASAQLVLHSDFVLPHCLPPDKGIFVGSGFDLCSVHEQVFTADFSGFQQDSGQLAKEILASFFQKLGAESGYCAVIGGFAAG